MEENGRLWVSRGYSLFYSDDGGDSFHFRAKYKSPNWRKITSPNRLFWRFVRGGFLCLLPLPDGGIVASVRGQVLRADKGKTVLLPVLHCPGRTFRLELTPEGRIYTGEYFYNRDRTEVLVYFSDNDGVNWSPIYRFSPGDIRHIHCIRYDPYIKGLVIATGDLGAECKILLTTDNFATVQVLIEGVQQARCYDIIPTMNGYYFATDTQLEQNYIQFLDRNGILEPLVPIAGSGLGACRVRDSLFFATAAEPSRVNLDPRPTLYGSNDGMHWQVIARWTADYWSRGKVLKAALFQMARIILTNSFNSERLYATTIAVQKDDGILHCWKIEE